jgi:hypothetical protein
MFVCVVLATLREIWRPCALVGDLARWLATMPLILAILTTFLGDLAASSWRP